MENLRVALVDDTFADWACEIGPVSEEGVDLTHFYKKNGGMARSLYLVGEPRPPRDSLGEFGSFGKGGPSLATPDRVREYFDPARAIEKIKGIDHDVLLVDFGIRCAPTDAQMDEYAEALARVRELRIVVPAYGEVRMPIARRSNHAVEPGILGGVWLGHELQKQGIPFSFWSSDYAHGVEGLDLAYTLGLVDAADIEHIVGQLADNEQTSLSGKLTFAHKGDFLWPENRIIFPGEPEFVRTGTIDLAIAEAARYRSSLGSSSMPGVR